MHRPSTATGACANAANSLKTHAGTRSAQHRRMTRETVAAGLEEAEQELQAAQREHDGTHAATVRYQAARDRHRQLTRLAAVLISLSDLVATLAA